MIRINLSDEELTNKVLELSQMVIASGNGNTDDGELQDVVNSKDEVIGSLPRGVIWDNGIQGQTRVVNIFVIDKEGGVLLPVRSMEKRYLPGGYDFSCGENLKAGETYHAAAVRGLYEELGLENNELREVGDFIPDNYIGLFCFGKVYSIEVNQRSDVAKFNTEEIERLEWKDKTEILKMIVDEPEKFKADYKAIFDIAFGG
ncbi:MAG: hypothetical protein UU93_C0021G0004 [Candidatus Amesbacteria bacterium GW2011_GWA2_42_12]|uniref:Nudix hydrolase domain-containing protein n=1 Tax=Candidatus Amesbacteria bacterium GW2011_GWA2_42_12 TaxID=1618356 RepID=A0A0G1AAP0_9BACT|nr:MAG: hypothetical protein UU93_C0021G0004 [Candidatus Amesbacteria bacterium GW2011_GWA2_42_12]KKT30606.1 MAG: hypothetical protein UW16_C0008G0002 [Microgenomates group bacterium GW2011_GWC1_44_10]KKU14453.1 MAG: hypothetical protein UX21_C0018G0004 [Microgenomates group bacterium GW2011_GWC2_45_8]